MSNLINTYPVFESSQVLTNTQLNQLVSYLDQQNRLTRVKLIGIGIVCGLELSYVNTDDETTLTISKGTGVTSEGFLISLGECTTAYYRPYELPEGVTYNPFDATDPAITLYELLRERPEDDTDVISLVDDPGFLEDKYVLLFLEIFDNDLKSCLANTCDDVGIDRILNIRKLLINKTDLDEVLEHSASVGNPYPDKMELPDVVMPRTLFDPEEGHSRQQAELYEHYAATINTTFLALFGGVDPETEATIQGALHDTYRIYEGLLGSQYDFENPFGADAYVNLRTGWNDFLSGSDHRGIQYMYDFMKDLILGYNEFRACAFDLAATACSPDMSLFPKHLKLGAAVPGSSSEPENTYRHGFLQPPIYKQQKHCVEKAVSLHKRLVLMVESFNLERIAGPSANGATPLRITPSDEKNAPLSMRSIPFYYDSQTESGRVGAGTLENYWNFDISRKKEPDTDPLVLGYENQADDQTADLSPLETPLYYDLDPYPFLRIEGHQGRNFEEALALIDDLKSDFDLPFYTVALQLDPDAASLEPDYSCGFEDLQEEYVIVRASLCDLVNDFGRLTEYVKKNPNNFFGDAKEDLDLFNELVTPHLEASDSMCKSMPECVDDFDLNKFQEGYKSVLQLVIYFNLVDEDLLQDAHQYAALSYYDIFLRIIYGFERRKHYLQKEAAVFSSFIRTHPGIAHQAGVYKGGTFILLYEGAGQPEVVADFSLPYLCCGTENCVPMCEDKDSDFEFGVPPLARPDIAFTSPGEPVDINVLSNDFDFLNREMKIKVDKKSDEGGTIEVVDNEVVRYTPPEGFDGPDTFKYQLLIEEAGLNDTSTVTVIVEEQHGEDEPKDEEELIKECYSQVILSCWAQGNLNQLVSIYNRRNRQNPISGNSEQQVTTALLASLRQTRGFSSVELQIMGPSQTRLLYDCIEPNHPKMKDAQITQAILDYQVAKCGNRGEIEDLRMPRVDLSTEDVTMEEIGLVLTNRSAVADPNASREELDAVLSTTPAGFSLSRAELTFFSKDRITRILKTKGIQFSSSETKDDLIDKLFE